MTTPSQNVSFLRAPFAVLLAWLVPGLGHIYLGHKVRGLVFLVAITLTFWTGVAIGGVTSVLPERTTPMPEGSNRTPKTVKSWWFFAQIMNGGYSLSACAVATYRKDAGYLSWPSGDVASVYSGVAGLLNLLIIIDALARAEGLPLLTRTGSTPPRATGPPHGKGRRRG